jgi:hypothetical protein
MYLELNILKVFPKLMSRTNISFDIIRVFLICGTTYTKMLKSGNESIKNVENHLRLKQSVPESIHHVFSLGRPHHQKLMLVHAITLCLCEPKNCFNVLIYCQGLNFIQMDCEKCQSSSATSQNQSLYHHHLTILKQN